MILSTLIRLLFITRYVKKSYPCAIKGSKVDHVTDPEGSYARKLQQIKHEIETAK